MNVANQGSALPPGVHWTPVDEALAHLAANLDPVTASEKVALALADGRVLAENAVALRANPPTANSAVDGYGVAAATLTDGLSSVPLIEDRAAAGAPLSERVPPGHAVRILTGAPLPDGVDAVVLQENATVLKDAVRLEGHAKPRANIRPAGEDVRVGDPILPRGHKIRPPDLALLAVSGNTEPLVRERLRVGILSTGDEIRPPTEAVEDHHIVDANRPMLLSLMARWGHAPVDLGWVPDDRAVLKKTLDDGARGVHAILTTGGASSGDEDHVAALLNEAGAMQLWRIAVKPGRPLGLGRWCGVPVFALPGNPVAAFVTALVFCAPSLSRLAGGPFLRPQAFQVPAAFSKDKKAGRREYLRARLDERGHANVFASEGSGRISGLAWSTGLVELADEAISITPGSPVRFIPYDAFG